MWRATFFNLLIINQALDKVSHLSFKQKGHNKTISLFSSQLKYTLKIFKQLTRNQVQL